MTLVTRDLRQKPEGRQDGRLWKNGATWTYGAQYEGANGFTVGEYFIVRLWLNIPSGATINSGVFWYEYNQKNESPAQTVDLAVGFEEAVNSAPWPYTTTSTDVAVGPSLSGYNFPRALGPLQSFRISYPGGATGADVRTLDVTADIQRLVNQPGWEAGNYVTIAVLCTAEGSGSDMAFVCRDSVFAAQHPELRITYTYDDDSPWRVDVNEIFNQRLVNTDNLASSNYYGYHQDGVTWAVEAGAGRDGGDCIRVTAHPPTDQVTRDFRIMQTPQATLGITYVFSGWFYNPSSNPGTFRAEYLFKGWERDYAAKDTWVPFSAQPYLMNEHNDLWCSCGTRNSTSSTYPDGSWFRVDDLCLTRLNVEAVPFTSGFTDRWNNDFEPKETATHGVAVRRNMARSNVLVSGVMKPRRGFVKRSDGLWVRSDPQLAGTTWNDIAAETTWDSVSAGATWDNY